MAYLVRFDSLDAMNASVRAQSDAWMQKLDEIRSKVQALIDSNNMSGQAAENIRSYFGQVHLTVIGLLGQLVQLHMANCLIYKSDYQSNVDSDLHAVIASCELQNYNQRLEVRRNYAVEIDEFLAESVRAIQNIIEISYPSIERVVMEYNAVRRYLTNLDEQIEDLENYHFSNDFSGTAELIGKLMSFITEQMSKPRDYMTDFSVDKLVSSASFRNLCDAYVAVNQECQDKAEALNEAIDNENTRVAKLQEEYIQECEDRAAKAKVFTAVVTAVCVVGAVAITVCTAGVGGAAGAVLIGAAVSASSGVITAAAGNLANQYVSYGYDHSQYDWGSLGKDVLVAGIVGAVTGAAGAGVGVALKGTGTIANYLASDSALKRVGANAIIGAATESTSGAVSRGTRTLLETGDVKEAFLAYYDLSEVTKDVVSGAGGSALGGIKEIPGIDNLMHSNSTVGRAGLSLGIGGFSKVLGNAAGRGAGEFVETGDFAKASEAAWNYGDMAQDGFEGVVGGFGDMLAENKVQQKKAYDEALRHNQTYDLKEKLEAAGISGVKETATKGIDFQDSDAILRTENGDPVQIKVKATGKNGLDKKAEMEQIKKQFPEFDFEKLSEGKDGYVRHRMDDYNATTQEYTVQMVRQDAKELISNQIGAENIYDRVQDKKYDKKYAYLEPSGAGFYAEVEEGPQVSFSPYQKISLGNDSGLGERLAEMLGKSAAL